MKSIEYLADLAMAGILYLKSGYRVRATAKNGPVEA